MFCSISAFAQKEDLTWVFGYRYTTQPVANGIYFHFNDSLTIEYKSKPMSLTESNASICDSSGNLLLLSNGCYIETGDGIMVENSDSLNPGWVYDNKCNGPYNFSYDLPQNMVMLPAPGLPSIYYLFHLPLKFNINPLYALFDKLLYTKIDLSQNNGNGKVLFKNQALVTDTFHYDGLAAIRHGNGRDWWVVGSKLFSNKYYFLLLSPNGITVQSQNIGEPTWSESGGEIVFSPDGTRMARFNAKDDLRIFDFDRCTGELSNPVYIPIQDDSDNQIFSGLAWSADGHFLYAAEVKRLLQFDMWATDIAASKTIVAERELSPACPLGDGISYLELGPDGRIYGRHLNGQDCMHRMNHPERQGLACEMKQNYYTFDFSYKGLPHFPNFRLGPVDGSPCDTLGLNNHPLAGWRYDHTGGTGVDFTSVSWYEPEQWYWDFGDPVSGVLNYSTERNPSHDFSAPGAYEVCLTVSNLYGSDSKCKTVWITTSSSNELQTGGAGVKIYPNPTTGDVYWTGAQNLPVTVNVFNALGQLQITRNVTNSHLDLNTLPQGVYHFQMLSPANELLYNGKVSLVK